VIGKLPFFVTCCAFPIAAQTANLWVTWDVFEPDTCASVWLIKRHVDPKATFRFLPKGTPVVEGTAFDTPEAKFRRYAAASTYESILKSYRIADPAAVRIGTLIHDIEVSPWARRSTSESIEVELEIREAAAAATGNNDLVERVMTYFDRLASGMGKRRGRSR
jgi:hypothetical protein